MKPTMSRPRGTAVPAMRTSDVPAAGMVKRKVKSTASRSVKPKSSTVGRGKTRGR